MYLHVDKYKRKVQTSAVQMVVQLSHNCYQVTWYIKEHLYAMAKRTKTIVVNCTSIFLSNNCVTHLTSTNIYTVCARVQTNVYVHTYIIIPFNSGSCSVYFHVGYSLGHKVSHLSDSTSLIILSMVQGERPASMSKQEFSNLP